MSLTPPRPHEPDCLFCRIVTGEIPARVVAESELAVAFQDTDPQAPVHVLVVPRAHYRDVGTMAVADPSALLAVTRLAAEVAGDRSAGQFRLVFNTGPQAQQTVFHVHAHVLGGRDLTWPPG